MSAVVTADLLDRVRDRLAASADAPVPATVAAAIRAEAGGVIGDTDMLAALRVLQTELTGAGPLEPLLSEPGVTDVLVTAPDQVWIDRGRGLERTGVRFVDGAAVARIGERTFVYAGSATEHGVSSWELGRDGRLTLRDSEGAAQGIGMNAVTRLQAVTLEGTGFVVAGAAGTGTLHVFRAGRDGTLTEVDRVTDARDTRFAAVSLLETVTVGGQTLIVAGGGDGGLSLFTLTPSGRLALRATIEDTAGIGLFRPDAVALVPAATGRSLDLVVHSASEPGLTHLRVDLGAAGAVRSGRSGSDTVTGTSGADVLAGGAGSDLIRGLGGADVLEDGAGADRMQGGAGADVFVLSDDGNRDDILDFNPREDRIDLSGWYRLYSVGQLDIRGSATGATIRYGAETLVIRTADGTALARGDFLARDLLSLYRPASLPVTPPPAPVRPDPDMTLTGTAGRDTLTGRAGNELLA